MLEISEVSELCFLKILMPVLRECSQVYCEAKVTFEYLLTSLVWLASDVSNKLRGMYIDEWFCYVSYILWEFIYIFYILNIFNRILFLTMWQGFKRCWKQKNWKFGVIQNAKWPFSIKLWKQ